MKYLSHRIKLYAKANGVNSINFREDVRLQDDSDGKGAYIKEWNLDIVKPTEEQLASYDSAATVEINNHQIRATRKSAYGDIGDQLDEIYKNIENWRSRIKSIKDANPKETE